MSDITRDDLYIWRAILDRQNGDRIEHRRITDEDVPAILRALLTTECGTCDGTGQRPHRSDGHGRCHNCGEPGIWGDGGEWEDDPYQPCPAMECLDCDGGRVPVEGTIERLTSGVHFDGFSLEPEQARQVISALIEGDR